MLTSQSGSCKFIVLTNFLSTVSPPSSSASEEFIASSPLDHPSLFSSEASIDWDVLFQPNNGYTCESMIYCCYHREVQLLLCPFQAIPWHFLTPYPILQDLLTRTQKKTNFLLNELKCLSTYKLSCHVLFSIRLVIRQTFFTWINCPPKHT